MKGSDWYMGGIKINDLTNDEREKIFKDLTERNEMIDNIKMERRIINTDKIIILRDIGKILEQKDHDYGSMNLVPYGLLGIEVRISDKISRIKNLYNKKNKVKDETMLDTIRDIIGYCIQYMRFIDLSLPPKPLSPVIDDIINYIESISKFNFNFREENKLEFLIDLLDEEFQAIYNSDRDYNMKPIYILTLIFLSLEIYEHLHKNGFITILNKVKDYG